MSLALQGEAVEAGARLEKACATLGLTARTVWRWIAAGGNDGPSSAGVSPAHKLTLEQRAKEIEYATSE